MAVAKTVIAGDRLVNLMAIALLRAGVPEIFGVANVDGRQPLAAVTLELGAEAPRAAAAVWAFTRKLFPELPRQWEDGDYVGKKSARVECTSTVDHGVNVHHVRCDLPDGSLEVDLVVTDSTAVIGVVVEGTDQNAVASLFSPLMKRLLVLEPAVGSARLGSGVEVLGRGDISGFVQRLLDPERRLPIVLVTSYNGRNGEYALDPEALAGETLGLAEVMVIPSSIETFALSDLLFKMGCFNGGVRVYWPGFSLRDLLHTHPLFIASKIDQQTVQGLATMLGLRAAQAYTRPDIATRAEARQAHEATVARVLDGFRQSLAVGAPGEPASPMVMEPESLLTGELGVAEAPTPVREVSIPAIDSAVAVADSAMAEVERLAEVVAQLEADLAESRTLLLRRDQRIGALDGQLQSLRMALASREDKYSGPEDAFEEPSSIEEAVLLAGDLFPREMVITDNAGSAASRMNTADNSVGNLWKALRDIGRVARRWQHDDLPAGMKAALVRTSTASRT